MRVLASSLADFWSKSPVICASESMRVWMVGADSTRPSSTIATFLPTVAAVRSVNLSWPCAGEVDDDLPLRAGGRVERRARALDVGPDDLGDVEVVLRAAVVGARHDLLVRLVVGPAAAGVLVAAVQDGEGGRAVGGAAAYAGPAPRRGTRRGTRRGSAPGGGRRGGGRAGRRVAPGAGVACVARPSGRARPRGDEPGAGARSTVVLAWGRARRCPSGAAVGTAVTAFGSPGSGLEHLAEAQLGGLGERAQGVARAARDRHHDVVALRHDLGLGDAEAVDALLDDLHRGRRAGRRAAPGRRRCVGVSTTLAPPCRSRPSFGVSGLLPGPARKTMA